MKHKKKIIWNIDCPEFEFRNIREFENWRFDRLGLRKYFCLLPPISGFTEIEWLQYEKDIYYAYRCIWDRLPIPENVEIRILKANAKIDLSFRKNTEDIITKQ